MPARKSCNRFLVIIASVAVALAAVPPENKVWPRPVLVPVPAAVAGVSRPVISLEGKWRFNAAPPADFWNNSVDPARMARGDGSGTTLHPRHRCAGGPGGGGRGARTAPQGSQIAYKTKMAIPADFAGKRVVLKFQGVTAYAKVWVNGAYIRDHFGGFTAWTCDITEHVIAGQDAWLTVGVTNRREGISGFNDGSILRDVKLMAVPRDHMVRFNLDTTFDANYRDAVLKVWIAMAFGEGAAAASPDVEGWGRKGRRAESLDYRVYARESGDDRGDPCRGSAQVGRRASEPVHTGSPCGRRDRFPRFRLPPDTRAGRRLLVNGKK